MSEIEALRRRIAELERERDGYAEQYAELLILQQILAAMSSTMEVDDILAMVLRGVREALRFARVVLFTVDDGVARRRLETGGDQGAIVSPDPDAFAATPTMRAIVNGQNAFALGAAGDGGSPLPDADGAYALLPLVSREEVHGVLYVDGPAAAAIDETQLQALFAFAAQAAMVAENARLFAETKRLLDETQVLAATDALTGLANRRALVEAFERELFNAERYRSSLTVMLLDLDDLKQINDTGGHAAGDDALRRFAMALRRTARKGDVVARYGGDEFVLLLVQADHAAATSAATRIFDALHAEGLRSSAGIAVYPVDGTTVTALTEAADQAVYRAKRAGKDRFEFSSIIVR